MHRCTMSRAGVRSDPGRRNGNGSNLVRTCPRSHPYKNGQSQACCNHPRQNCSLHPAIPS
ncbi:hypothetical protein HMPREF3223_02257 [Cutibacterium avidum]|nr:hypothetical protein HMPREF3223_02257 [Cutibacterium avidum]